MKDWEAKKPDMRAAINAVQDLHAFDKDTEDCESCEVTWPCPTLMVINDHISLSLYNPCPYTMAHTRKWCGYPMCRDS